MNGDIRNSFIRRGGGDERCTKAEIERFLRDAAEGSYDSEMLRDIDSEEFFDPDSVAWYRGVFQQMQGGRYAELSDLEFLNEWGFVVESGNALLPTRAAVLLFGKGRYVRQILPRGIVDYQRIDTAFDQWSPEKRWHDRVVFEDNIIQAWQILVEKYIRLAERPFNVDATTFRRPDDPPDYISFREATINLLTHQDYGDHTRKPVIKIFTDRTIFWNPGDAFATDDQLLDPTEKEVRNPAIVNAFRRIGLSDQAGTGIRSIIGNWRQLGNVPPVIENNKGEKSFGLTLLRESLMTEAQKLFEAQLGVHLSEQEAAVFAYACRKNALNLMDVKAIIGRGNRESKEVLDRLVTQALLREIEAGVRWEVAEHLRVCLRLTDQVSDQAAAAEQDLVTDQAVHPERKPVTPKLTSLSDQQRRILELCEFPRKQAELMVALGLTHRTFFRRKHLEPLLRAGMVKMTYPGEPTHPDQGYVITEAALGLLSLWKAEKK